MHNNPHQGASRPMQMSGGPPNLVRQYSGLGTNSPRLGSSIPSQQLVQSIGTPKRGAAPTPQYMFEPSSMRLTSSNAYSINEGVGMNRGSSQSQQQYHQQQQQYQQQQQQQIGIYNDSNFDPLRQSGNINNSDYLFQQQQQQQQQQLQQRQPHFSSSASVSSQQFNTFSSQQPYPQQHTLQQSQHHHQQFPIRVGGASQQGLFQPYNNPQHAVPAPNISYKASTTNNSITNDNNTNINLTTHPITNNNSNTTTTNNILNTNNKNNINSSNNHNNNNNANKIGPLPDLPVIVPVQAAIKLDDPLQKSKASQNAAIHSRLLMRAHYRSTAYCLLVFVLIFCVFTPLFFLYNKQQYQHKLKSFTQQQCVVLENTVSDIEYKTSCGPGEGFKTTIQLQFGPDAFDACSALSNTCYNATSHELPPDDDALFIALSKQQPSQQQQQQQKTFVDLSPFQHEFFQPDYTTQDIPDNYSCTLCLRNTLKQCHPLVSAEKTQYQHIKPGTKIPCWEHSFRDQDGDLKSHFYLQKPDQVGGYPSVAHTWVFFSIAAIGFFIICVYYFIKGIGICDYIDPRLQQYKKEQQEGLRALKMEENRNKKNQGQQQQHQQQQQQSSSSSQQQQQEKQNTPLLINNIQSNDVDTTSPSALPRNTNSARSNCVQGYVPPMLDQTEINKPTSNTPQFVAKKSTSGAYSSQMSPNNHSSKAEPDPMQL